MLLSFYRSSQFSIYRLPCFVAFMGSIIQSFLQITNRPRFHPPNYPSQNHNHLFPVNQLSPMVMCFSVDPLSHNCCSDLNLGLMPVIPVALSVNLGIKKMFLIHVIFVICSFKFKAFWAEKQTEDDSGVPLGLITCRSPLLAWTDNITTTNHFSALVETVSSALKPFSCPTKRFD